YDSHLVAATLHTIISTLSSASISSLFNDTAPTEIYTLSLHDALPILQRLGSERLVDLNSTVEQQKRVDIHFRYSANYWRDLYNANGLFEVIHQQRRAIVLGLVDELALPSGSHILEIGCGAGLTTIALAQRGFTVQAVDTVDRMVALTRQAATEAGVAEIGRASCRERR